MEEIKTESAKFSVKNPPLILERKTKGIYDCAFYSHDFPLYPGCPKNCVSTGEAVDKDKAPSGQLPLRVLMIEKKKNPLSYKHAYNTLAKLMPWCEYFGVKGFSITKELFTNEEGVERRKKLAYLFFRGLSVTLDEYAQTNLLTDANKIYFSIVLDKSLDAIPSEVIESIENYFHENYFWLKFSSNGSLDAIYLSLFSIDYSKKEKVEKTKEENYHIGMDEKKRDIKGIIKGSFSKRWDALAQEQTFMKLKS